MRSILGNQFPDEEAAEKAKQRQPPKAVDRDETPGVGERVQPEKPEYVIPEIPDVPEETEAAQSPKDDDESIMAIFEQKGTPQGLEDVKVKALLTTDEYNRSVRYPNTLYTDNASRELFVVAGTTKGEGAIFVYDRNYYPTAILGSGRGIINPKGVAVDQRGFIYVTWIDTSTHDNRGRLTVFNGAFFKNREINISPLPHAASFEPEQVALGDNGSTIYLAGWSRKEGGAKGVLVLDAAGNFKRWLVPLQKRGEFDLGDDPNDLRAQNVEDVVVDGNGRIYLLCPEAGKVFVLDSEANLLFTFGAKGGTAGKFSQPRSLAVDVRRAVIYVVDYMRHSVSLFAYDGDYLFEIGGMGGGPGWFQFPTHVAVDWDSNLVVADHFNHRVQVLEVP